MQGCRRHLVLRAAETATGLVLPYRVANDSNMLLAFKQPGSAHWDLLGCGELCGYVLDLPDGERSLRVYARDPSARWQVLSESYDLTGIGPGADIRADSGPERPWEHGTWQHGTLRPEDALLLSTACKMRYGDVAGAVADGWLCVTDARLTFMPFEVSSRMLHRAATVAHRSSRPYHDHGSAELGDLRAVLRFLNGPLSDATAPHLAGGGAR